MALWHENQKPGSPGWRRHLLSGAAAVVVVLIAVGAFAVTNVLESGPEPRNATAPPATPARVATPAPATRPSRSQARQPSATATPRIRVTAARGAAGGAERRFVVLRTSPGVGAAAPTPRIVRRATPVPRPRVSRTPPAPRTSPPPSTGPTAPAPPATTAPPAGSTPPPPASTPSTPRPSPPPGGGEYEVDEHDGHGGAGDGHDDEDRGGRHDRGGSDCGKR